MINVIFRDPSQKLSLGKKIGNFGRQICPGNRPGPAGPGIGWAQPEIVAQGIRRAGIDDIVQVPGISYILAGRIYDQFHGGVTVDS